MKPMVIVDILHHNANNMSTEWKTRIFEEKLSVYHVYNRYDSIKKINSIMMPTYQTYQLKFSNLAIVDQNPYFLSQLILIGHVLMVIQTRERKRGLTICIKD